MNRDWLAAAAHPVDTAMGHAARARQARLTKPPGSLGQLEELGVRLATLQGTQEPVVDPARVVVFVADHGVAEEGVSAYPQAVTAEMLRNFASGGAAISVMAQSLGVELEVIDVGIVTPLGPLPGVRAQRVGPGSANLRRGPAMNDKQLAACLEIGREAVARAADEGSVLFIGAEMGIANTTAATAVASALLGQAPGGLVGPGTGLDQAALERKRRVVEGALTLHREVLDDPRGVLRCVGGFDIAALTGAFVACAQRGLPVLVDGFIATVAALAATRLCAGAEAWFVFGHRSAEPGHGAVLEALEAHPLLDLGLRLGEGTGAAAAFPLLRLAAALHGGMATFEEAGISRT